MEFLIEDIYQMNVAYVKPNAEKKPDSWMIRRHSRPNPVFRHLCRSIYAPCTLNIRLKALAECGLLRRLEEGIYLSQRSEDYEYLARSIMTVNILGRAKCRIYLLLNSQMFIVK